jgi:hypothetical protein
LPKNKFNSQAIGQYTSDPEVLDLLVKPMKPEDDAYLSFSEASDNEYEYFVKRVRKQRPDPQSNE